METNIKVTKRIDPSLTRIWNIIADNISMYLLQKCYYDINSDRIDNFLSKENSSFVEEIFNEEDFIKLRYLGIGSSFISELVYHIEKEKLFVIKKITFNDEGDKLPNRELNNYRKIKHPFIPKYYGITSKNKFLVIEYIFGETLSNFDLTKINENDKINIIFELMAVIHYLHQNQFVYRDLHLNNVMIDKNKTIILIDFDRMININDIPKTQNFGSYYAAPEITNNKDSNTKLSYQSDIYSLGKIIYYIMTNENPPDNVNEDDIKLFRENSLLLNIYHRCVKENYKERPFLVELIYEYIFKYTDKNFKFN